MSTIHIKPSHEGKLHRALDIPMDQPIPEKKLQKALDSTNANVRKEAVFAENSKKINHKK